MLDKVYIKFYKTCPIEDICTNVRTKEIKGTVHWFGTFHNFKVSAIGFHYKMEGSLSHYYFNSYHTANFVSLSYKTCCSTIKQLAQELGLQPNEIEVYGLEFGTEVVLPFPVCDYINAIRGMKTDGRSYKIRSVVNQSTLYLHNKGKYRKKWKYEQALVLYDKVKEMMTNHPNANGDTDTNIMKVEMRLLYDLKRKLNEPEDINLSRFMDRKFFDKLSERFCSEIYGLYGCSDGSERCDTDSLKDAKTFIVGYMVHSLEVGRDKVKSTFPNLSSTDRSKLNTWMENALKMFSTSSNINLIDELKQSLMRQMPIR